MGLPSLTDIRYGVMRFGIPGNRIGEAFTTVKALDNDRMVAVEPHHTFRELRTIGTPLPGGASFTDAIAAARAASTKADGQAFAVQQARAGFELRPVVDRMIDPVKVSFSDSLFGYSPSESRHLSPFRVDKGSSTDPDYGRFVRDVSISKTDASPATRAIVGEQRYFDTAKNAFVSFPG